MPNPVLQLQNVSLADPGRTYLAEININLFENEMIGLIGPNGSGKTTLMKLINGLTPISSGARLIDHTARLSFVPQGRRIIEDLTVNENIEIGDFFKQYGTKPAERKKIIYDLFPMLHSKRQILSKDLEPWEKQLLSIARGLMSNPTVLILDEPYYGLSPDHVKLIILKIFEIHEKIRLSMIISAQSLHEMLKQIPRVYVLDKGRISNTTTGNEFFNSQLADISR